MIPNDLPFRFGLFTESRTLPLRASLCFEKMLWPVPVLRVSFNYPWTSLAPASECASQVSSPESHLVVLGLHTQEPCVWSGNVGCCGCFVSCAPTLPPVQQSPLISVLVPRALVHSGCSVSVELSRTPSLSRAAGGSGGEVKTFRSGPCVLGRMEAVPAARGHVAHSDFGKLF